MNKLLGYFTRLLPVWTVLLGFLGYFYPQGLIPLRPHIDWLFTFTMLGIGAVMNYEDFIPIFRMPQKVILGTLAQFSIMPFLGFMLAKMLNLPPALSLGVILVGSVPGAMASNVISYLAGADVAYSIALTSASTFLAPILTPVFTYLFAHTIIDIKFWPMFFSIIKMVIAPLLAGFFIKRRFRNIVERFTVVFPALSTLFIALICGLIVALNKEYLVNISVIIFLAVFLHNLLGLVLGYGAARLYGFDIKRRRTLSIEVGMQNAGLGAVLALKHFSAETAIAPALFATWCVVTASILAEIWSKDVGRRKVRA